MGDALSQETMTMSGLPCESGVGPLLFLLPINDLPNVVTVLTLLFTDYVKMVSPRSQSGSLQSSL